MKTKVQKKNHRLKPVIFSMTNRTLLFLFAFLIVTVIFYVTGSLNQFLDSNLLFILRFLQVLSVLCMVFSLACFFQSVVFSISCKQLRFLFYILLAVVSAVVAVICFFFAGTMIVVANGNA
ncbi:MAG: hypothetical protein J6B81_02690 [Spirochaetaceae bacterium]|nr:hypothetical protein [Spirochaetaceae bacterium]